MSGQALGTMTVSLPPYPHAGATFRRPRRRHRCVGRRSAREGPMWMCVVGRARRYDGLARYQPMSSSTSRRSGSGGRGRAATAPSPRPGSAAPAGSTAATRQHAAPLTNPRRSTPPTAGTCGLCFSSSVARRTWSHHCRLPVPLIVLKPPPRAPSLFRKSPRKHCHCEQGHAGKPRRSGWGETYLQNGTVGVVAGAQRPTLHWCLRARLRAWSREKRR